MATAVLHRAVRLACVAILLALGATLLALGAASSADARDLYWQGQRDQLWKHGVDPNPPGLSNWYSKRVGGNALRAPNGGDNALFPGPAQETNIRITREGEEVSSLTFQPTSRDHGYTFQVQAFFSIVGFGIFNDAPVGVTPRFTIASGKQLAMRNDAKFDSGLGVTGARFRILDSGVLSFWENSSGGDGSLSWEAAEVVNHGGAVFFAEDSSAGGMKITNRPQQPGGAQSSIRFHDNSDGARAKLTNGENGLIDFATTERATNRVSRIDNNGDLTVGAKRLFIADGFTQGPLGTLWIDRAGAFHGVVVVDGVAKLGGTLKVQGFFGAPPKTILFLKPQVGEKGSLPRWMPLAGGSHTGPTRSL